MHDINIMSKENALDPNRRNSLPYTDRTFDKVSAIKGLVVCKGWDMDMFKV